MAIVMMLMIIIIINTTPNSAAFYELSKIAWDTYCILCICYVNYCAIHRMILETRSSEEYVVSVVLSHQMESLTEC
jgi:hypothetical protein